MLSDIILANNHLKKIILNGAPAHILYLKTKVLQLHVATLMNNQIPGLPKVHFLKKTHTSVMFPFFMIVMFQCNLFR